MQISASRLYTGQPRLSFGLKEGINDPLGPSGGEPRGPDRYDRLNRQLSSLLDAILNSERIDAQLLERLARNMTASEDALISNLGMALSMAAVGHSAEMENALQGVRSELDNRPRIDPRLKLGLQAMMAALLLTTRQEEEQAYGGNFFDTISRMFGGRPDKTGKKT